MPKARDGLPRSYFLFPFFLKTIRAILGGGHLRLPLQKSSLSPHLVEKNEPKGGRSKCFKVEKNGGSLAGLGKSRHSITLSSSLCPASLSLCSSFPPVQKEGRKGKLFCEPHSSTYITKGYTREEKRKEKKKARVYRFILSLPSASLLSLSLALLPSYRLPPFSAFSSMLTFATGSVSLSFSLLV